MQYLLLIHGEISSAPSAGDWDAFFREVRASGFFKGGSEIGARTLIGDPQLARSTEHVVAYMRFDTDDKPALLELIQKHPVVLHGGAVELCELPKW